MTTPKQTKANQLNAEKSTGPKSKEGKAVVSKNAVKHGLLSFDAQLPWESAEDIEALNEGLVCTLKPEGELERVLVDRIVSLLWRLRRAGRIESGIYALRKYSRMVDAAHADVRSHKKVSGLLDTGMTFSTTITDDAGHAAATQNLLEKMELANSELPTLGRTFIEDAEMFATLNRYEVSLEKSLYKALHELQRLQAFRGGIAVPLPFPNDFHGDNE